MGVHRALVLLILASVKAGYNKRVQQPIVKQARALTSSTIFLEWVGPINHPGGFKYRIYIRESSKGLQEQEEIDLLGYSKSIRLKNLRGNVRYIICVGVVELADEARSGCDHVVELTTPFQKGYVSRSDRKYLTKGNYYQTARHYWPLDYETQIRDIKYSLSGRKSGTSVSIAGNGAGYLEIGRNSWARLGRFRNECLCNTKLCSTDGISLAFWLRLSTMENGTKVLLGTEGSLSRKTGVTIFQVVRNQTWYLSAVAFMGQKKWKTRFKVQPGKWVHLTVTWSGNTGLHMYKNGLLITEKKFYKEKSYLLVLPTQKCVLGLSPPSTGGTVVADYDDVIIWDYELDASNVTGVYNSSIDPPRIENCDTFDGVSLDMDIVDTNNVYEFKQDYKISWNKFGDSDSQLYNYTSNPTFHIENLESSEYSIVIQRRLAKGVYTRASRITCSTRLQVPSEPLNFAVTEKAPTYFLLNWHPPTFVYGIVQGYKISYKVDDFAERDWKHVFLADVNQRYLDKLEAYTDYVIKLLCSNEDGSGAEVTIRATTAESVPDPPSQVWAIVKEQSLYVKWKNSEEPRGIVNYRVIASVNYGNETIVFSGPKVFYKMDDLAPNTTYTFWVVTYNVNNNSRYQSVRSDNVTITTPSFAPKVPRGIHAVLTLHGVNIVWRRSDSKGLIGYKLLALVNGTFQQFCNNCGLSYIFKNISVPNTIYSFWVVAYTMEKGYESAPSQKVIINSSVFVPSVPMVGLHKLTPQGLHIFWNASFVMAGRAEYKLFEKINGTTRVLCTKCGLGYTIVNVEYDTEYIMWLVSYNVLNGLESAPGQTLHVKPRTPEPQFASNLIASETTDATAIISWRPPSGKEQQNISYKVVLFDVRHVLQTFITRGLELKLTNLTQFTRYYVTVQVSTRRDGFWPPSPPVVIQTKDKDECIAQPSACSKHALCTNSDGSYFCSCVTGYVGTGFDCVALPADTTVEDFCPEELARNTSWKKTYRGHSDTNLCPNGTAGISTRECIDRNDSIPYWSDPNLSNCISAWMSELDDKLADPSLNATAVGGFFLDLLEDNSAKGLYGGDVIKSVEVIDTLYNNSKGNELDEQQSNAESASNFVKNVINITEKILEPNTLNVWKDIPKDRRTANGAQITQSLENVVIQSAKLVNHTLIQNEHIVVWYGNPNAIRAMDNRTSIDTEFQELNRIKLPQGDERNSSETRSAAVIRYNTIGDVLAVKNRESGSHKAFINAPVLSVTMNPPIPVPFQEPFEFVLDNRELGDFESPKCVFFDMSKYPGFWSTNGCIVANATTNYTICRCYHMTSFSVLMQVKDIPLSYSDELALGWITRIGLSISLVALGLAFLTFMCLPRPCGYRNASKCFRLCEQGYRPTYLKKVRSSIHSNLIFSLALGEIIFLWGIEKTETIIACYAVAAALHYLLLVAFFWMAAEGVILYLVLVKVFQRKSSRKDKRMFMVICWGTPAAIVCISLAVGYENYLHDKCCWLSVTHGLIWSFVGPALMIIMVNTFFLCCTFRVMARRSDKWKSDEKKMADKIRYWAKGVGIVTCLLGITWIFGIFFIHDDSIVVAYLFNICNAFQGLFIFIFHCLLDEKIRQQYYQVFCSGPRDLRSSSNSNTGTVVKKDRRRGSTFNSWLWSVVPIKYHESKSESCPAENTVKRLTNSTPSLSHSACLDTKIHTLKLEECRPRINSSIYHDSDENMDNIPDRILTVKHSKPTSEQCEENSPEKDFWISTLSRENSHQVLHEVPQTTCEDCLYEVAEWDEAHDIQRKTNSWHELQLRKRETYPVRRAHSACLATSECSSLSDTPNNDDGDEQALLENENETTPCEREPPASPDRNRNRTECYVLLRAPADANEDGNISEGNMPVSV